MIGPLRIILWSGSILASGLLFSYSNFVDLRTWDLTSFQVAFKILASCGHFYEAKTNNIDPAELHSYGLAPVSFIGHHYKSELLSSEELEILELISLVVS